MFLTSPDFLTLYEKKIYFQIELNFTNTIPPRFFILKPWSAVSMFFVSFKILFIFLEIFSEFSKPFGDWSKFVCFVQSSLHLSEFFQFFFSFLPCSSSFSYFPLPFHNPNTILCFINGQSPLFNLHNLLACQIIMIIKYSHVTFHNRIPSQYSLQPFSGFLKVIHLIWST